MMLPLHDRLRTAVRAALTSAFGLAADAADVPLELRPSRTFGDLGSPVAFELARTLRKAPRAIAQEMAAALGPVDGVLRVEAAPNGYLNVFLDRAAFLRAAARPGPAAGGRRRPPARPSSSTPPSIRTRPRTSATCATPRSATRWCACCASAARRSRCRTTSTTPACRWPTSSSASGTSSGSRPRRRAALADTTRFDYYCWDLYARVTEWYDGDKARLAIRAATLHDIEHGGNDSAAHRRLHRRPHRPLATWRRWRG